MFEVQDVSSNNIEYYRESANFYTPRIRNGEIRIMKYLYVAITIMYDVLVLCRGREGVFALSTMLI